MTSCAPTVEGRQVFSIDLVPEGANVILRLSGELDMSTVGKFSECANASLSEPTTHSLVVDLGGVTFMDCTGLGSLVDLRRRAVSDAKGFELRSIPPRVTRLLDLSGIGNDFATGQGNGSCSRVRVDDVEG